MPHTKYMGLCRTLFTSFSISTALNIIQHKLEQDQEHPKRTNLTIQHIIELSGFCLHKTHFLFYNEYYEQMEGKAMGSPVSPIVANVSMEYFKKVALRTTEIPPRFGKRYVHSGPPILKNQNTKKFLYRGKISKGSISSV